MRTCLLTRGLFCSLFALAIACGDDGSPEAGTDSETGTGTGSGSTTTVGMTTDPSAGSNSGTSASTTGPTGCVPGMSIDCTCPNGAMGAQVCNADGSSYGPCECTGGDTGTGTTDGTSGTSGNGDGSTGGTTTGAACEDPGPEPNEDESSAVEQDEQACDADTASTFDGVLDGPGDVDWHTFHGSWVCGQPNPAPELTLTASEDIRLCAYAECDQGTADVTCLDNATDDDSPDGRPGCCAMGSLGFGLNCAGAGDESADIYVRLDQAPEGACVDYSVDYTFPSDA